MKYICALCVMILLIGSNHVQAQEEEENKGIVFRVQLAAGKSPLPKTHKFYKDFDNTEAILFDDGYYRYYTGEYVSYHECTEYLKDVVKPAGYNGAYIVALDGMKRMSADAAIDVIYGEE